MNTPSVSGISMTTSVSTIPRELPPVITLRYRSAIVFVPLPVSHEVCMHSNRAPESHANQKYLLSTGSATGRDAFLPSRTG